MGDVTHSDWETTVKTEKLNKIVLPDLGAELLLHQLAEIRQNSHDFLQAVYYKRLINLKNILAVQGKKT